MRILFITQEDYLTGAMFSVSFLAKGIQDQGHVVWIAAHPDSALQHQAEKLNIAFLPVSIQSKFDRSSIRLLKHWVDTLGIEIINAQSSKDRYISVFARWLYRLPVKVVHTRRQVALSVGGFLQNLVYVNGTDKVVAVSYGVKRSLMKKGIPSRHIKVIRNGTPSYKFQIDPERVRILADLYHIQPGDWVIGCIARRKKQDQLLAALQLINRPVKVILIGFEEDDHLRQLREKLDRSHQIIYPGNMTSSEALQYLPLFTCYVLCSTTEGLSQSLLEAMYAGVPVIATGAAGNLDLIRHETNGLLFEDEDLSELANAIKRVHQNSELRERMVMRARRQVSGYYSMNRVVDQYVNFFSDLLSSPKNQHAVSTDSHLSHGPRLSSLKFSSQSTTSTVRQ